MRLLKSLTIIVLSSLPILSMPVLANTKQTAKVQETNNDKQLKLFNRSVQLRFGGIHATTENNEVILNFRYSLKNISKKSISKVEWSSIYLYKDTPILEQDVPVTFKKLMPKKEERLTFSIPLSRLTPTAQQVFSNPQNQIRTIFKAKSITFTDKSKIVVE